MVKYYDLTENDISVKPFEQEAIYYCSDSKNIYFDSPTQNKRIKMSSDNIILSTEEEKDNILAPIINKIYIIIETGNLYIYDSTNGWIQLGGSKGSNSFELSNVFIIGGSKTIDDIRIKSTSSAKFIPDLSIADLISSSTVECYDGSLIVTITPDTYNIMGRILVYGAHIVDEELITSRLEDIENGEY